MPANPPSRPGAGPFFSDAPSCKRWLADLPRSSISQAQQLVLDALRALSVGVAGTLERLMCLELLRDQVALLLAEQRPRYFDKTLPLPSADEAAWSLGRSLLEAMESGYRECLRTAQSERGGAERHLPLIMQRIVRCLGAQMMFHAMVYRRFDSALWLRAHGQFAAAERDGLADETVKDGIESADGASSVHEAYVHVVLTQAAYLSEMTASQMVFLESALRLWPRKVRVLAQPPAGAESGSTYPLVVVFDRPIGARPLHVDDHQPAHRVLGVEELSKSIRRRLTELQSGEEPANLGLPAGVSAIDAHAQLGRLHRLWCEGAPPRPPAKVPEEKTAELAFGLPQIHFIVTGGAVFEQPDRPRELTRREKDDLAVFGRVTERTLQMRVAELNFELEKWGVVDEMPGAWRLLRPKEATRGVAIGRILAMRLRELSPVFLGVVRALAQETDGRIVMTVALFPGRPEPIPVRAAAARIRREEAWMPAFRLPAQDRLGVPQSLVLPSGMAARGRGIDLWAGSAAQSTVYELLERGTDFDRVTVS